MAFKFQVGSARLSGSTTFEEELTAVSLASLDGGIDVNGSNFTVSTAGAVVAASSISGAAGNFEALGGTSLALQGGGISAAGAIAGATSIDGSGDLTMGTITMTGFSVDADGDTALKSLAIDDGSTIGPDSVTDLITLTADGDLTFKDGTHDFDIASHDGTNGLMLAGTLVTSDAGEINLLDGAAAGTVVNSKAVIYDGSGEVVATSLTASTTIAGASLKVGNNSVISNFEGTGLSVTAGVLNASVAGQDAYPLSDTNQNLSGGINFFSGAIGGARTLTLPAASDSQKGVHFIVKAATNCSDTLTVTITASSDDQVRIDGQQGDAAKVVLESPGAAVTLVGLGASHGWAII